MKRSQRGAVATTRRRSTGKARRPVPASTAPLNFSPRPIDWELQSTVGVLAYPSARHPGFRLRIVLDGGPLGKKAQTVDVALYPSDLGKLKDALTLLLAQMAIHSATGELRDPLAPATFLVC